tara:strand:+ start:1514 stop:2917 length:1404 start_codon:yes stop_codon:yes gene_type:complete
MAIQVYDMGLDFTKGEGDKPESISDFRKKQSETKLANAQADKYRAEAKAGESEAAILKLRGGWLKEAQALKDEDGNEASELDQLLHVQRRAGENGDSETYGATGKAILEHRAGLKKTQEKELALAEANKERRSPYAYRLSRDASDENIIAVEAELRASGDIEGADGLKAAFERAKLLPEDQRRLKFSEMVSVKYAKHKFEMGKTKTITSGATSEEVPANQLGVTEQKLKPGEVLGAEVTREGHQKQERASIRNESGRNYRYETTRSDAHDKLIKDENKQAYNNLRASEGKVEDMQLFLDQLTKLSAANDKTTMGANWEEGMTGYVMSFWKGSDSDKKTGLVKAIKANQGFNRLQKMRDESATGGALGQVAVKELEFLQAAIGHLDEAGQDEQAMRDQIEVIKGSYDRLMVKYQADVETGGLRPWFEVQQELIAKEAPPKSGVTLNNKSSGKPRAEKAKERKYEKVSW